jgi:transposase
MRFSTQPHKAYCGLDLHARSMDVCILNQGGAILRHRNMQTRPEVFLKAIAPSREDLVVAVACLFPWYGLADLCAQEQMPFVLGHALSMQAIHGGKAQNDKIDSQKIAVLRRGGMLPQASVSPAAMRATRDVLRRRCHLPRQRAALLAHIQQTNRQYNLPEIGKKLASKAKRDGVAERFPAPAVPKSVDVALALIDDADALRRDGALPIGQTAKEHHAPALYRLPSVPGRGTMLRVLLLYEIHDRHRLPSGQECVSSCRLVTWAKASAGKRCGTAGATLGHTHLKWAFSEAAVLGLRNNPAAPKYLARLEHKPGQGKAFTLVAPQGARAVYDRLQRDPGFDLQKWLNGAGSGADEPHASLDNHGLSLAWSARILSRRQGTRRSP